MAQVKAEPLEHAAQAQAPVLDYEDDDDPILGEIDIFIKPRTVDDRELMVLQFPNRQENQPYNYDHASCPTQFRMKSSTGMVELDIPIDTGRNYDRDKGVKWGSAMKYTAQTNQGGFGMAAGFGIGGGPRVAGAGRGRGRGAEQQQEQPEYNHDGRMPDREFEHQRAIGSVLKTQTLGGQVDKIESWSPQYMLGTFYDGQFHITPVDHITQLRPQFHHIDAFSEQERLSKTSATAQARVAEARTVQMTIKNTVDGEEEATDTMAERIAATQAEEWQRHEWIDEESEAAYAAYGENLVLGEGKVKADDLRNSMPQLESAWMPEEFLDIISAPRDAAKLSRSKIVIRSRSKKKDKRKMKAAVHGGQYDDDSSSASDQEEEPVSNAAGDGDDLYDA
ncbi:Sin-like protein conserved region-domain-containing protein [Calycina marina]|uniref:Sin-like protein conserved region-domain-containing protein n=1 Tax=Calycina marina TaxID=1763456 RepID=A0A9P7YW59_9HELO|nr:Sin-like protein conserved region-domain-containing protein [Calycina marina]